MQSHTLHHSPISTSADANTPPITARQRKPFRSPEDVRYQSLKGTRPLVVLVKLRKSVRSPAHMATPAQVSFFPYALIFLATLWRPWTRFRHKVAGIVLPLSFFPPPHRKTAWKMDCACAEGMLAAAHISQSVFAKSARLSRGKP